MVGPDFEDPDTVIELISTQDQLNEVFANGGAGKLMADITVSSPLTIAAGKEAVLDLNGHNLNAASTATVNNRTAALVADGGSLTVKNGTVGSDDEGCWYGVYSKNNSTVVLENVTFGEKVTYAYNGSGKLEAKGCKFHGWLSGWHGGAEFDGCEFGIGKEWYPAAICYGNTVFRNCKFFNNGTDADDYGDQGGPDDDGYYRCNYVVSLCEPATSLSFVSCKFIDASNNETDITATSHPVVSGWGDGSASTGATITVDGVTVTL